MVCPMARASAGSPDAPTAAALSYCGRSKAGWLARRATAPPSSSTAMKSGVRLAACRSALNCASCSGSVMFLPNWQMPPTGYACRVSRMASVSMVTPSAFASLMVSCGSVRSKASGRMMKSWPIFSSGVSASAGAGAAVGAGVDAGVGVGAAAGRVPDGAAVQAVRVVRNKSANQPRHFFTAHTSFQGLHRQGSLPHPLWREPFGPVPLCRFATSPHAVGSHPRRGAKKLRLLL